MHCATCITQGAPCVARSLPVRQACHDFARKLTIAILTGSKTEASHLHTHTQNPMACTDVLGTGSMTAHKLHCSPNSFSAAHRQCCSGCQHSLCCPPPRLQGSIQCCSISVVSTHKQAIGQVDCSAQVCWGRLQLRGPHQCNLQGHTDICNPHMVTKWPWLLMTRPTQQITSLPSTPLGPYAAPS